MYKHIKARVSHHKFNYLRRSRNFVGGAHMACFNEGKEGSG